MCSFFFFSSRRRHTRSLRDWSSDVCSSDLISAKALRLYEERGLVAPARTPAGWRAYGPVEMARCAEIVALRALGLSVGEVARILNGDTAILGRVLAAHEATLEARIRQCTDSIARVRR